MNTKKVKVIGDPCWICGGGDVEAPCRYGNCAQCGGHSEHNWGCATLSAIPGGGSHGQQ